MPVLDEGHLGTQEGHVAKLRDCHQGQDQNPVHNEHCNIVNILDPLNGYFLHRHLNDLQKQVP